MKLSSFFVRQFSCGGFCLLLGVALFSGCKRDEVKVYHVESTDSAAPVPATAASSAMPMTMPAGLPAPDNSGLPQLKYTTPAGWSEKTPSQMRVASFGVSVNGKTADISVIPMGGMAGGATANVTRWRGQVGLPPVTDDEAAKLAEKISVGDQPADLYDLNGGAQRILAASFHRDDTEWFFKMTGDAALVEAQKPAFVSFLKSVQFSAPVAAAPAIDLGQLPPSHPPIDGMNSGVPAAPANSNSGKPKWTLPAGWQEGELTQFLIAKYVIAGAGDAKAEVNVSSLENDGGGLLPNVNRWRGQLGLPPVTEVSATMIDVPSGKASVVDFSGTNARTGKPARLIGVMVPLGGQTWFYKLMGDEQIVAQQHDAFMKFIQSANYANAR